MLVSDLSLPLKSSSDPYLTIGRYETSTQQCEWIGSSQTELDCSAVQLNGRSPTVIVIRFIGRGGIHYSRQQLTFVTLADEGKSPLKCSSGSCQINAETWQSRVFNVAETNFDPDGIATGVPKTWSATEGECVLKNKFLHCSAQRKNGQTYQAKAHF